MAAALVLIVNFLLKDSAARKTSAGIFVIAGLDVLLFVVGLALAIYAMTQIQRVGSKGVIGHAIAGLLVNGLFLVVLTVVTVSSYRAARDRIRDVRSQVFMSKVAAEMNRSLPKMIDEETELVSAVGLESTLVYNYRLVKMTAGEIDKEMLVRLLRPEVVQGTCNNPKSRDTLLRKGIRLRFVYLDKDRKPVTSFDVTERDCGLAAPSPSAGARPAGGS